MPEILEVETYRRALDALVGEQIVAVATPDDWFVAKWHHGVDDPHARAQTLVGATIESTLRHGKLLVVDTTNGQVGLRFGMTGRPVIDGSPTIEQLEYSTARVDPAWDRFVLDMASGRRFALNDPRRLGGVEFEPDLDLLGPDVWRISPADLAEVLAEMRGAAKPALLRQDRLAGLGNLLADELLWRSGIAPTARPADLDGARRSELASLVAPMLDELAARGGSHTGDLFPHRHEGGHCPRDGAGLVRTRVGGRTSWWCPHHQLV